MSDRVRCHCRRCTIRSLMGPAVVITVGVLFLLQQSHIGFSFGQTWPVILVVIGVISLASSVAPMDGHIDTTSQPLPPNPPVNPVPPVASSDPFSRQGQ